MSTYADALRAERVNLVAAGKADRVAQVDALLAELDAGTPVVAVKADLDPTDVDTTEADHSGADAAVIRRGRGRAKD